MKVIIFRFSTVTGKRLEGEDFKKMGSLRRKLRKCHKLKSRHEAEMRRHAGKPKKRKLAVVVCDSKEQYEQFLACNTDAYFTVVPISQSLSKSRVMRPFGPLMGQMNHNLGAKYGAYISLANSKINADGRLKNIAEQIASWIYKWKDDVNGVDTVAGAAAAANGVAVTLDAASAGRVYPWGRTPMSKAERVKHRLKKGLPELSNRQVRRINARVLGYPRIRRRNRMFKGELA